MTVQEELADNVWMFTMEGAIDDDELGAWLLRVDQIARESVEFAILVDVRWTQGWAPSHTRRVHTWVRNRAELLKERCRGMAFVATLPFVRGAIRAMFGAAETRPCAISLWNTRDDAADWARITAALRVRMAG